MLTEVVSSNGASHGGGRMKICNKPWIMLDVRRFYRWVTSICQAFGCSSVLAPCRSRHRHTSMYISFKLVSFQTFTRWDRVECHILSTLTSLFKLLKSPLTSTMVFMMQVKNRVLRHHRLLYFNLGSWPAGSCDFKFRKVLQEPAGSNGDVLRESHLSQKT
jgi:hypothetical protein